MVAGNAGKHDGKPRLLVSTGPETMRVIRDAIASGLLPDTYVTDGQLIHIELVSGLAAGTGAADEDSPLPISASASSPDLLGSLLAENLYLYKQSVSGNDLKETETFPLDSVLKKVLAKKHWPEVPPLKGIIGAPVLRRNGTLLQVNGYDEATGFYLRNKVRIDEVPDKPSPEQVSDSRAFIVNDLLGDFAWEDKSDKANYLAALVSQILRPYLKSLVPLVIIKATSPASGKTVLTSLLGMLYGQKFLPWPYSEEEMAKTLITAMCSRVGVVIFDNLPEGTVIDSAILAGALTAEEYSTRKLGGNDMLDTINDKIWIATGNNLQTGGDIGSRAVMVRLDPDMPDPEQRSGFVIENLPEKALDQVFQSKVLWCLLILVADWVSAGAPATSEPLKPMRQFTPWMLKVGGFLEHHAIPGFLGNREEARALNEDDERRHAFLSTWHELHQGQRFTVGELHRTALTRDAFGNRDLTDDGPWQDAFPKTAKSQILGTGPLGKKLKGIKGRWAGNYALRTEYDSHAKGWIYWVEKRDDAAP